MDISFVIPTHNRNPDNLGRLVYRLRHQTSADIIVVDTSDNPDMQYNNRAYCVAYSALHVLLPRRDFWKARSLNIGINAAITKYVACMDVDMYPHKDFVYILNSHLKDRSFVMAVCGYLPKETNFNLSWDDLMALAAQGEISRRLSPGGLQVAEVSWFKAIGGYDERFTGPDGVDCDMMVRARKYGLNEIWIEDPIVLLHQWHEKSPLKGKDSHLFSADPEIIIQRDWLSW